MINEFRTFIMRGNMIDLAVGIVIGAAFTTVVNSFVNDILMPPIGLLLGRVDFSNLFVTLGGALLEASAGMIPADKLGDHLAEAVAVIMRGVD